MGHAGGAGDVVGRERVGRVAQQLAEDVGAAVGGRDRDLDLAVQPPRALSNDGTVVQLVCTSQLYRVFERC